MRTLPNEIKSSSFHPNKTYYPGDTVFFGGLYFVANVVVNPNGEYMLFDSTQWTENYSGSTYQYESRPVAVISAEGSLSEVFELPSVFEYESKQTLSSTGTFRIGFDCFQVVDGIFKLTTKVKGISTTYDIEDISSFITDDETNIIEIKRNQNKTITLKIGYKTTTPKSIQGVIEYQNLFGNGEKAHYIKISSYNVLLSYYEFGTSDTSGIFYDSGRFKRNVTGATVSFESELGYTTFNNYGHTGNIPVDLTDVSKSADGSDIDNTFDYYYSKPVVRLCQGDNLFNKKTATIGFFLNGSDEPVENLNYDYSDYIKVSPDTLYSSNKNLRFCSLYDQDKVLVHFLYSVSSFNTTENTYYIRATLHDINLDVLTIVNTGEVTSNLYTGLGDLDGFTKHSNGIQVEFEKYTITDYISVEEGKTYIFSPHARFITAYDSGMLVDEANGFDNSSASYTVPSGVSCLKVTIVQDTKDTQQIRENIVVKPPQQLDFAYKICETAQDGTPIDISQNLKGSSAWLGKSWTSYGDSITAQNEWQPFVSSELGLAHSVDGVGGSKLTGANGDTEAMCQDARIDALPESLDLLTLMCGTNDWAQNVALGLETSTDPTEFYGAIYTFMQKIIAKYDGYERIVVLTTPYGELEGSGRGWPNDYENTQGLTTNDYAEALKKGFGAYGIPVIDINKKSGWNTLNLAFFTKDDGGSVHPNSEYGGPRIAEVVIGGLKSITPVM